MFWCIVNVHELPATLRMTPVAALLNALSPTEMTRGLAHVPAPVGAGVACGVRVGWEVDGNSRIDPAQSIHLGIKDARTTAWEGALVGTGVWDATLEGAREGPTVGAVVVTPVVVCASRREEVKTLNRVHIRILIVKARRATTRTYRDQRRCVRLPWRERGW